MASLRSRNGAILFAVESVEGVAETLAGADDAILAENIQPNFNPQNVQTNEVTGSLDNRGPIVGGVQMSVTFDVYMKGSGSASTAPECGTLLQCCGWTEHATSTAVPAAAEACATGTTTSATLGASATGVADAYTGMPISFTSGLVDTTFIAAYSASKVATLAETMSTGISSSVKYQIPVNVRYVPKSTSIPTGTLGVYIDGVCYLMKGCRGTFTLAISAAGAGKFSFTFTGTLVSKTDASVPTCTYDSTRPPIWRNNICVAGRKTATVATFNLDNGNTVIYPPDPAATQGFGTAVITERAITGSMDPEATLVATRDIFSAMTGGTMQIVHMTVGASAGNRVAITVPTALYTNDAPGDRSGIATEQVNFSAIGQDSGAYICFY